MQRQDYPYNLILDIFKESANIDERINQVDIPNLYNTLDYLPEDERVAIRRRYQDGVTFKLAGISIGQPTTHTRQIVNRGLKRLRRFAEQNYFQINPSTGVAYTRNEIEPYIGELQLASAAETALIRAGYSSIEKIRPLSEDEIKSIENFGERHYEDYAEQMASYEIKHGLTPYAKVGYPENLIRVIYENDPSADTTADTINITGLEQALKTLSQQERLFILMKYKEGLSMQRIGEIVGLSTNRISQAMQRGLFKMKEKSRTKYFEPAGKPKKGKSEPKIKAVLQDVYPFNIVGEILGKDDAYLRTAYLEGFHTEINNLPKEFRTYVRLRYEFGLTRASCGKRLNKTPYEIEILERHTHNKLRDKKHDGLLTAISKNQFQTVQQQNKELTRENESLKTLLQQVASGEIKAEEIPVNTKKHVAKPKKESFSTPIEELNLSTRAYNILSINRWDTLHAITQHTREEFNALRRVGAKIEQEIDDVLAAHSVSFKNETPQK